jgi:hypothetical protein
LGLSFKSGPKCWRRHAMAQMLIYTRSEQLGLYLNNFPLYLMCETEPRLKQFDKVVGQVFKVVMQKPHLPGDLCALTARIVFGFVLTLAGQTISKMFLYMQHNRFGHRTPLSIRSSLRSCPVFYVHGCPSGVPATTASVNRIVIQVALRTLGICRRACDTASVWNLALDT